MDRDKLASNAVSMGGFRFITLSNLVSYLSLVGALASVYFALRGVVHLMAAMWVVSALADYYDGWFARWFKRSDEEKRFGVYLDSLIDAVAFGFAPVVGLWIVVNPSDFLLQIVFFGTGFVYILALITRLGNFMVLAEQGVKEYFGLIAPDAAVLLATVLLLPGAVKMIWLVLPVLALLMLSSFRIPLSDKMWLYGGTLWIVVLLVWHGVFHFYGSLVSFFI